MTGVLTRIKVAKDKLTLRQLPSTMNMTSIVHHSRSCAGEVVVIARTILEMKKGRKTEQRGGKKKRMNKGRRRKKKH